MDFYKEPEVWRLYNSSQKFYFNDLDFQKLSKIISTVPPSEVPAWFICKVGDREWLPLIEKIEEITSSGNISVAVDLAGYIEDAGHTKVGANPQSEKSQSGIEKRKISRVLKNVKVLIDLGGKILACQTKDISPISIKLDQKFSIADSGASYHVILRSNPSINLRCSPLLREKEYIRGTWNILKVDPGFNLAKLVKYLETK